MGIGEACRNQLEVHRWQAGGGRWRCTRWRRKGRAKYSLGSSARKASTKIRARMAAVQFGFRDEVLRHGTGKKQWVLVDAHGWLDEIDFPVDVQAVEAQVEAIVKES